jgi:hypothetical protein
MEFNLQTEIDVSPYVVFIFLRDKHLHDQEQGSPVLLIEKVTPDPVGVGTRFREVVQMLPWYKGEILSEITTFHEGERIVEEFWGAGMIGRLEYLIRPVKNGTQLYQRQQFKFNKWMILMLPLVRLMLGRRLRWRLNGIKEYLETNASNFANP